MMMNAGMGRFKEAFQYVAHRTKSRPSVGVILGSGLGWFADELAGRVIIDAKEIPGYPVPTVEGHAGRLVFGKLGATGLLVFQGRVHLYEGYTIHEVVCPVMMAHELGVRTLILTNDSGGINPQFRPGDLMLITDHVNLTFEDPRIGDPDIPRQVHRRLPTYDESLLRIAEQIAADAGIVLRRGAYGWTKGPSYETAAEIEMFRRLGADVVGMSTVPEVIMAHHLGMKVLGISLIANPATGISPTKLSHTEVTRMAAAAKHGLSLLLKGVISRLA